MMDIFAKESFIRLANVDQKPCISIYIPTHRGGHEVNEGQDAILYKNALKEVEEILQKRDMKSAQIKEMLAQAYEVAADGHFWRHQSDTLAVFIAPDFYMHYTLPIKGQRSVTVNNHLYLTPLLPLLAKNDYYYYVLALAKGSVKLYEATPNTIAEIKLGDLVPHNIHEALKYDDAEPTMQQYGGPLESGGAVFHGHGGNKDVETEQLQRYLKMIDKGLHTLLSQENAPLVLASDKNVAGEFKKVSHHKNIMEDIVQGHVEYIPIAELHEMTRPIVTPYFHMQAREAIERFNESATTDAASCDIKQVVLASYMHRVDTLLIKKGVEVWGDVDLEQQRVQLHTDRFGTELVNQAAVQTLLNGGQIFLLNGEMPVKNAVAAIYRYDMPPKAMV